MSVPAGPPDVSRVVGKISKQLTRTFADADAPRARGVVGTIINVPAAYWGNGFARMHKGQRFPVRVVGFVQGTSASKDRWYFWDHHPEDEDDHGTYPIAGTALKRCQTVKPAAKKKSPAKKKRTPAAKKKKQTPAAKKQTPAAKQNEKPAASKKSLAKSKSAAKRKRKRVPAPSCLANPNGPSIRSQFAAKARTQVALQQRRCGTRRSLAPRPYPSTYPAIPQTHADAHRCPQIQHEPHTHTRTHARHICICSDTGKPKHTDVESIDMVDGWGIASR